LLGDLVATTPGDEGKWFTAAKEAGLFDEAIRLARSPGADVWGAYANTMKAAERLGRVEEMRGRIRTLVAGETFGERFVTRMLGREPGL
jgi:hypothetical protein